MWHVEGYDERFSPEEEDEDDEETVVDMRVYVLHTILHTLSDLSDVQ